MRARRPSGEDRVTTNATGPAASPTTILNSRSRRAPISAGFATRLTQAPPVDALGRFQTAFRPVFAAATVVVRVLARGPPDVRAGSLSRSTTYQLRDASTSVTSISSMFRGATIARPSLASACPAGHTRDRMGRNSCRRSQLTSLGRCSESLP